MTAIEDRLAAARERYLASLTQKADRLVAELERGDLTELRTLVHRLAGSAALHQLDAIAEHARAAEALCVEPEPSGVASTITDLVAMLQAAHAEVEHSHG